LCRGGVDRAEEASIINNLVAAQKSISIEAEMASMEREMSDKPALHRTIYLLKKTTGEKTTGRKWYEISFEDGTTKELPDGTKPQAYWEAKTNMTAAEAKEVK
jgi:hypothetical protein